MASDLHKRPRGSPTGITPVQLAKKPTHRPEVRLRARRNLTAAYAAHTPESVVVPATAWSVCETLALVRVHTVTQAVW